MSEEESKSALTDAPVIDDETYAFVQEVFQLARAGDAERLKEFLEIGLAPNIRDGKGNSLLMLANRNDIYAFAGRNIKRLGISPPCRVLTVQDIVIRLKKSKRFTGAKS